MFKTNWQNKLIFFAVVVAIIPIAISGAKMISSTKDELKSSTNFELMTTAGQLAQDVNTFYANRWLAPLLLIRSGLESEDLGAEEKATFLSAGIKSIEDIVSLALIFEVRPGEQVIAIETQKETFVQSLQAKSIKASDVLSPSFPEISELVKENRTMGSPRYVQPMDVWLVTMQLPVKITGAPSAVLCAQIQMNTMRERVHSQPISKNGRILLIDQSGKAIFDTEHKDLTQFKVVQEATNMLQTGSRAQGVTTYVRPTGEKVVGCYAFPQDLSWAIIAEINEEEAYLAVSKMLNSILLWVLLGLVIAASGAVIFSRKISKPILTMSRAAEEISSGQFDVKVEYKAKDEIGVLAKSLVNMGKSLKENFEKIEKQNKELEEYSKGLEVKVGERTAELRDKNIALEDALVKLKETQDQLIIQAKLASLGALTAGIAHEIKNPLNFINNFAILSVDLVNELDEECIKNNANLPAEKADNARDIMNNIKMNVTKISEHGKRADRIVHSMLQHSRGNTGEFQMTDLNTFIDEYASFAYESLRAKDPVLGLKMEHSYDPAIDKVNMNQSSLSQVLLNIINNAAYAAKQKKAGMGNEYTPTVKITTRNLGDKVEIRLRDNGPGIPKKHIEKIFEPFFTTKPTGEGTGLGLSLSYDIITRMHKGEFMVESAENQFTEFIIILPKK